MDDLADKIKRVLADGPPLRLAILFGSAATGRARPTSDVDLAILPCDPELPLSVELRLASDLSRVLGREIDLVRLDQASTLVRWEVARTGVSVIAEPISELTRFRASAASDHADFAGRLNTQPSSTGVASRGSVDRRLLILKKLSMLCEHVARVRRRRPATVQNFEADIDLQDAVALSVLVAVQEAADIALHLAADESWGLAGSYAEAFELLSRHGVISSEHARDLGAVAAVRNRIAHGYASVDPTRLWTELPAGLDILDRFAEAIARFAEPE